MENEVKHIFVFFTPFHVKAATSIFGEILDDKNTLVIYHSRLEIKDLQATKIALRELELTKDLLFLNGINWLRRKINILQDDIDLILGNFKISDSVKFISGTDRELFSQFLIQKIKEKYPLSEIILMDEGVGFYADTNLKDKFYKFIYPLISKILFNYQINYIRPLGSHPYVNTIYLRYNDLLKNKNKKISYLNFNVKRNVIKLDLFESNKLILLYSFPDQNYNLAPQFKIQFYRLLLRIIQDSGYGLIIKPHPREIITELKELAEGNSCINVLDGQTNGEDLPFENFNYILNFKSSIVLELLNKNYPIKNIITLGFRNKLPAEIHFKNNYFNTFNFNELAFKKLIN